jgi:hypothetical protein
MKKITKILLKPFNGTNRGSSLPEVLIAGGICLSGFAAATTYIGQTTNAVSRSMDSQDTASLESAVKQYIKDKLEKNWEKNSCETDANKVFLGPHKLHQINHKINVVKPSSRTAEINDFFQGADSNDKNDWNTVNSYCSNNQATIECILLEFRPPNKNSHNSEIVEKLKSINNRVKTLVSIKVNPYDFDRNKPVAGNWSGCKHSVTDPNGVLVGGMSSNKDNDFLKYGSQAKYILVSTVQDPKTGDYSSSYSKGTIYHTIGKEPGIVSTPPSDGNYDAFKYSCWHNRCLLDADDFPPNPALDKAGYDAYRQSEDAKSASICKKCERSKYYK